MTAETVTILYWTVCDRSTLETTISISTAKSPSQWSLFSCDLHIYWRSVTAGLTPLSIDVYGGYSPDYVIIDLDRKIEKQQLLFKMSVLLVLVNENQENYYKCLSLSNLNLHWYPQKSMQEVRRLARIITVRPRNSSFNTTECIIFC